MAEVTSFEGQFLLKAQDRLATLVPEIRYSNLDFGQLKFYEKDRPSVSFPCCLFDFSDTQYADLLEGVQEANMCVIAIRVATSSFSRTSNLQPLEVKQKGLYILEIVNKVYVAFQGWMADGLCSPLTRIRKTSDEIEDDAFKSCLILFTTAFQDDTAKKVYTSQTPNINLSIAFGQLDGDGNDI